MPLKQNITPLSDIVLLPEDVADSTNETMVKHAKIDKQLDELYTDAVIANRLLGRFINQVVRGFSSTVGGIKPAPMKLRPTARAKLLRPGANMGVEDLKDIARATITFNTMEAMYAARDYIRQQPCYTRLGYAALKDRYTSSRQGGLGPTAQGYRDIKFFLSMAIGRGDYHIVELQLNNLAMLKAKDIGHPFYDVVRIGGDDWLPTQANPNITIPRDKVEKLAWKLLYACHECTARNIEPEAARLVERMVKREFFTPVFNRNARTGSIAVVDRKSREPRVANYVPVGRAVTLRFGTPARIAEGEALLQVSPAVYQYYKKQAQSFQWSTADNMHLRW